VRVVFSVHHTFINFLFLASASARLSLLYCFLFVSTSFGQVKRISQTCILEKFWVYQNGFFLVDRSQKRITSA
jgi:hypothetical protein